MNINKYFNPVAVCVKWFVVFYYYRVIYWWRATWKDGVLNTIQQLL